MLKLSVCTFPDICFQRTVQLHDRHDGMEESHNVHKEGRCPFILSNQRANALNCSRCPLHPSHHVHLFDIEFRIRSRMNRETRTGMAAYRCNFHFRDVSRHRSLYGGRMVADSRSLVPFVENRIHKGCVISCVGCLETRK